MITTWLEECFLFTDAGSMDDTRCDMSIMINVIDITINTIIANTVYALHVMICLLNYVW